MRKEIGQALRKQFAERLKVRVPEFREIKPGAPADINPGSRLYAREVAPDLWFFIVLVPSIKEADEFWIELAWSRDGSPAGLLPAGSGTRG